MQGAMLDKDTAIGLILGTGTNACYLERAERVQHWEVERHGEKQVTNFIFILLFLERILIV